MWFKYSHLVTGRLHSNTILDVKRLKSNSQNEKHHYSCVTVTIVHKLFCVSPNKQNPCCLAVWIQGEVHLPQLPPETHQLCQGKHGIRLADMPF